MPKVCVTAEELLECLLVEFAYWKGNDCVASAGAMGAVSNVIAFATSPSFRAEWHPAKPVPTTLETEVK